MADFSVRSNIFSHFIVNPPPRRMGVNCKHAAAALSAGPNLKVGAGYLARGVVLIIMTEQRRTISTPSASLDHRRSKRIFRTFANHAGRRCAGQI